MPQYPRYRDVANTHKRPEHLNMKQLKAIRERCLDCSGGVPKDVRECPRHSCNLYPFRMGKNPNRAGIGQAKNLRLKTPTQAKK